MRLPKEGSEVTGSEIVLVKLLIMLNPLQYLFYSIFGQVKHLVPHTLLTDEIISLLYTYNTITS